MGYAGWTCRKWEDEVSAVKREILEETGYVADELERVGRWLLPSKRRVTYFECREFHESNSKPDSLNVKWFKISELSMEELTPDVIFDLKQMKLIK